MESMEITPHVQLTEIFCVLDEAQIPANSFRKCFLSENEPKEERSILREIITTWSSQFQNLVVSGTGVSMRDMKEVLKSAVAKYNAEPVLVTDVGGFDTEEAQKIYLLKYIPEDILDATLTSTLSYWLRGR
jgi:hypothetical protein